jgi:hypothetical protein
MKIDSYHYMKTTFDYFCSVDFKPCINNPMFVIAYDENQDYIDAGWIDPVITENLIYVMVDYDEALHFNKKIYEEKIAELQLLIKEDKVKKKLQDIDGDFV